jgi:S-adenosylmethionine:diacylglycerol 3-amino-3-carboxypropyl transferase
MEMTATITATSWERGRFDARRGPSKLLFGCVYEDASIELGAFRAGSRVFCIASAGCTAMKLAPHHEVVAVDLNPVQLAYAERRFAGGLRQRGTAERILAFVRTLGPLAGWRSARLRSFLAIDDPAEQIVYWHRYFDTRRFRAAFDLLLSVPTLRSIYAPSFLHFLPRKLGALMRGRMERCFALHPNRTNPYARALLLGEMPANRPPPEAKEIRLVHADAASFLEGEPAGSFDGFALSNILDGASAAYERRLFAAVRRAAAPGAVAVLRSFREPPSVLPTNQAANDRAMLWGIVDVRSAIEF